MNVKVLDVKPAEERISLSIKALEEAPARPARNNDNDGEKRDRKPRAPRKACLLYTSNWVRYSYGSW